MGDRMTEDLTFAYAGYAKATIADVIEGDGLRWVGGPCWNVVAIARRGDRISLELMERAAAVNQVLHDGGLRAASPSEQAEALLSHWREYDATDPVWIRL